MEKTISSVKYVGPALQKRLSDCGISTLGQLVAASLDELTAIPGIGHNMAPLIQANARELLAGAEGGQGMALNGADPSPAEGSVDGPVVEEAVADRAEVAPPVDAEPETVEQEVVEQEAADTAPPADIAPEAVVGTLDEAEPELGGGAATAGADDQPPVGKIKKSAVKKAKKAKKAAKKAAKRILKETRKAEKKAQRAAKRVQDELDRAEKKAAEKAKKALKKALKKQTKKA